MRWLRVFLVLVGTAIIVIVGSRLILERSDRAATQSEDSSPAKSERNGPTTPPSSVVAAQTLPGIPSTSDETIEQRAQSPDPNPAEGTDLRQTAANDDGNRTTQAEFGAVTNESAPNKVEPFRISQSVLARCRTNPEPNRDSCEKVYALINEMNREERDVDWASRTESRIRDVVNGRIEAFEVRRVVCRMSLCAVEVVATFGTHFGLLREKERQMAGIEDDGTYVIGWESDPYQGELQITLRVFTRRIQ
jgi:hypothetical protein